MKRLSVLISLAWLVAPAEPARQASKINANRFMGSLPRLYGCFCGRRASLERITSGSGAALTLQRAASVNRDTSVPGRPPSS